MNRLTVAVLATFVVILVGSGILAYVLSDQPASPAGSTAAPSASPGASIATPAASDREAGNRVPLLGELFGPDASGLSPASFASWEATSARIALRFSLAAFLASLLAFRPRRGVPVNRRNPYVAQTQILMAVVAGGMMMVVGDSAARAFGIFAAASLVRFRTNIRDPKEITVLLVCLGIGLATGVGKIEMAIILSLFVLVMLWVLEYYEPAQVFRALELTVRTRRVDETDTMLREIFDRYQLTYELRILD